MDHIIKVACKDVVYYVGNTFLAVMLARAVRLCDPASEKTISVAVAIDHKAMLGNRDNYRLFANVAELAFPKSRPLDDLMKTCTVARGQQIVERL